LIPTKDGRVRKVKLGFKQACAGGCMVMMVVVGTIYVGIDYSRFISAKSLVDNLIKKSKEATVAANQEDEFQDSLVSQIKFLSDEHKKYKEYEKQVRQRLAVLKSSLDSGVPLELFEESNEGSLDNDVGGAELDCGGKNAKGLPCISRPDEVKASLTWNMEGLLSDPSNDADLIRTIDRYISTLEKMPFVRPVVGWVSSGFGLRRSPFTHKITKHQGIDFSVPYNSAVTSTADGVVKSVTSNRTYGLFIDVQHTDRVTTRYAHLSKASVKVGKKVCRGEIIGTSGSSGRSTGPHLHYEIRVDKKPIDPRSFLSTNLSMK